MRSLFILCNALAVLQVLDVFGTGESALIPAVAVDIQNPIEKPTVEIQTPVNTPTVEIQTPVNTPTVEIQTPVNTPTVEIQTPDKEIADQTEKLATTKSLTEELVTPENGMPLKESSVVPEKCISEVVNEELTKITS